MKLKYDKESDAAYIYLGEAKSGEVASTQGDWPIHIDITEDGTVVGIEIMDASTILTQQVLESGEVQLLSMSRQIMLREMRTFITANKPS